MVNSHTDLIPHSLYRLAYNADDPYLRGKLCTFVEYVTLHGMRRARVALIAGNGGIYYVTPGLLINGLREQRQ